MKYGLRWQELNKRGEVVPKERFFKTNRARNKHIDQLVEKGILYRVDAFLDE